MDVKEDIASEALRIVTGSRRSAYGTPERNFERIARLWNAHLANRFHDLPENVRLAPGDVAALMRLMKEARLAETPDHRDSFVDLVGYSLCGAEVAGVQPTEGPWEFAEVIHPPHKRPLHLVAKKGDEVCTGFHSSGSPRWISVVSTDGPPEARLFCENGSSAGHLPNEHVLAIGRGFGPRKPLPSSPLWAEALAEELERRIAEPEGAPV